MPTFILLSSLVFCLFVVVVVVSACLFDLFVLFDLNKILFKTK